MVVNCSKTLQIRNTFGQCYPNIAMPHFCEHCRAKLNLYLAVTGRRTDGYHELLSLVAQLDLGDELDADVSTSVSDTIACDDAELSCGADNLVLKAAAAFRRRVPEAPFMAWRLTKRVPYGAGLGGGSSDAAGALRILNRACGNALDADSLAAVAAEVGSDCPLFLRTEPVVMRGRGEILTGIPLAAREALAGRDVVVVKPSFGVPTGWAYAALDKAAALTAPDAADAELNLWLTHPTEPIPMRNSFTNVVFRKYQCYDALDAELRAQSLPRLILTGSGSACFAFADGTQAAVLIEMARKTLGEDCFAIFTRLWA
jgi:4-diphosphocytidyl-2-C-methyl-D-erythritol kinase